jgi:hypothetical protein
MIRRWSFILTILAVGALLPRGSQAADRDGGIADFPGLSADSDWPWWRGPGRNGIASGGGPVRWSATENIAWKAPVPGRGHASPIVVGNRVVLATADEANQIQSVVAFHRQSGAQLWKSDVSLGGFPARIHRKNSHASPTVACDGERIFILFFNHHSIQATALDLDGKQLWQAKVSDFDYQRYKYGYASSPVVYKETVILAAESDGQSFLAALDRQTGREVWRTPRPVNISYSTPSIGFIAGRDQLLISGAEHVSSYDPATGKPLWSAAGTTAATCGTIVWEGDVVIASGGYPKAETVAIRADGSGKVLWKNVKQCYEQSMLAWQGHVYALTDNGILHCWRISDGQEMWKERLQGPVSASPVLAGGNIYWANGHGTMYVFRANPEKFELLAENVLGDESLASPAVAGGQLFLRVASVTDKRRETLYCIGSKK